MPVGGFEDGTTGLLQFTGLHDKSGNEIYEGDIIVMRFQGKENMASVKWSAKKAYWSPFRMTARDAQVEVIGNIYESPELLK